MSTTEITSTESLGDSLRKLLIGNLEDCGNFRKCCVKGIAKIPLPITLKDFVLNYVTLNIPCILESWATDTWESIKTWTINDTLNTVLLNEKFGGSEVPVVNCDQSSVYSLSHSSKMLFSDFLTYMTKERNEDDKSCLYLKDWHSYRENIGYKFYSNIIYFQSDWLNEFWDNKDDDYRFVYMGPKNSHTPLHADVFRSYSWSANICGRKKWIIHAPCSGSEPRLCNNPAKYEVIQKKGEIIFIPSGWFHEVYNEEDTISINHNWINAFNVDICWNFLKQQLRAVEEEIQELNQMEGFGEQCQRILRADSGMDYGDLYNFIHFIATRRIEVLWSSFLLMISNELGEVPSIQDTDSFKTLQILLKDHEMTCRAESLVINSTTNELNCVYLIDVNRILYVLKDFIGEYEILPDTTKTTICSNCRCHPRKFLRLLEHFTVVTCDKLLENYMNIV